MIHHLSIGVREPERVARVLAELWHGVAMPFPVVEGGWVTMKGDAKGSMVEVTPLEMDLVPGVGQPDPLTPVGYSLQPWEVHYAKNDAPPQYVPTHASLSTPLGEEEVHAIAKREGWRSVRCDRGPCFPVVEVWLENRLMVEILPPEFAARYTEFMTVENMAKLFGVPVPKRAPRTQSQNAALAA